MLLFIQNLEKKFNCLLGTLIKEKSYSLQAAELQAIIKEEVQVRVVECQQIIPILEQVTMGKQLHSKVPWPAEAVKFDLEKFAEVEEQITIEKEVDINALKGKSWTYFVSRRSDPGPYIL